MICLCVEKSNCVIVRIRYRYLQLAALHLLTLVQEESLQLLPTSVLPLTLKRGENHKRKCLLCICIYLFIYFLVASGEILECLTSVISIWVRLVYFGQMCVVIGQVQLNFPASLSGLCWYFCEWISLDLCSLLCAQNQLHCHPSYIIIKVQCQSASL